MNSHLFLLDALYHIIIFMKVIEFKLKQQKNPKHFLVPTILIRMLLQKHSAAIGQIRFPT